MQALGKFTVHWNRRGPVYYACWFGHSSDYFKCAKGLQGSEVVTHNKDDYGVVNGGEYIPFTPSGTIDKITQAKLLQLPRPFFVSQFLSQKVSSRQKQIYKEPKITQAAQAMHVSQKPRSWQKKTDKESKFPRMYTYPGEKFIFPETKKDDDLDLDLDLDASRKK